MKIPLNYQYSEYDCVPTTFLNALRFVFDKKDIPPEIIKQVYTFTLDTFSLKGEPGKYGTSETGIQHLCEWLESYKRCKNIKISCTFLQGQAVDIEQNKKIAGCIEKGGVILAHIYLTKIPHYVLVTSMDENSVCIFDPYYRKRSFFEEEITMVENRPESHNRIVDRVRFNMQDESNYALGPVKKRACVLFGKG